MAFIVSCIIGANWAKGPRGETPNQSFSITSDGFVTSGNMFIGNKNDFVNNIRILLDVSGLTSMERALFEQLYAEKVQDWSTGYPGKGEL